ncbi:MAG: TVP38/TMEM64 family protein [Bauldia sp.]|nr:TVP38/TMEM64 family protein [Bauldia sp.]MCW5717569.1 TVP38/TMEM64 family protein [Bauldia sp.]
MTKPSPPNDAVDAIAAAEAAAEAVIAAEESVRRGPLSVVLRWSPLVLIVVVGIAAFAFGVGDYLSLSNIIRARGVLVRFVEDQPAFATAAYVGIYMLAVVFSVPGGSVFTIVGGIMFGGLVGGLITTAGAVLGSLGVFLVARTSLAGWTRRRMAQLGPRINAIAEGFRENAFSLLIVLRLIPVMPYWASNALPAIFGVGVPTFVIATTIGLLPWTVSFAFFGAALDDIVAAQERANPGCADAGTCEVSVSVFSSPSVLTGFVVALLALVPVIVHWWYRRRRLARERLVAGDT